MVCGAGGRGSREGEREREREREREPPGTNLSWTIERWKLICAALNAAEKDAEVSGTLLRCEVGRTPKYTHTHIHTQGERTGMRDRVAREGWEQRENLHTSTHTCTHRERERERARERQWRETVEREE